MIRSLKIKKNKGILGMMDMIVNSLTITCGDGCNAFPQKTRQRNQRKSGVWRG